MSSLDRIVIGPKLCANDNFHTLFGQNDYAKGPNRIQEKSQFCISHDLHALRQYHTIMQYWMKDEIHYNQKKVQRRLLSCFIRTYCLAIFFANRILF